MLCHVWVCWVHTCVPVHVYSGMDAHVYIYMHRSEVNVRCLPQPPATVFLTLKLTDCHDWLASRLFGTLSILPPQNQGPRSAPRWQFPTGLCFEGCFGSGIACGSHSGHRDRTEALPTVPSPRPHHPLSSKPSICWALGQQYK